VELRVEAGPVELSRKLAGLLEAEVAEEEEEEEQKKKRLPGRSQEGLNHQKTGEVLLEHWTSIQTTELHP